MKKVFKIKVEINSQKLKLRDEFGNVWSENQSRKMIMDGIELAIKSYLESEAFSIDATEFSMCECDDIIDEFAVDLYLDDKKVEYEE